MKMLVTYFIVFFIFNFSGCEGLLKSFEHDSHNKECDEAFAAKEDNRQSVCTDDVSSFWLWGSYIDDKTVNLGSFSSALYLADTDNCDNSDNTIIGYVEISTMENNTLKIKYVVEKEGYKISEVDFGIKEVGIDEDYKYFNETVDKKTDHTLYIPWSGNITHNSQQVFFIENAKVCYNME